ncbi:bis(5'-nucleosyl)-tetraphosphatase (symmetrical) YqeK [Clostridiaceae bacterium M8S5]|nr:bis(5'-nucleosyl)-tetraphosphatase (symmetrical) YqeK [Clostridiaceae bacterium M8S5]
MHNLLEELKNKVNKDNSIKHECIRILDLYDKSIVSEHTSRVASKAVELARLYKTNEQKAEIAGYLHDISAVIPNESKIEVAQSLNLDIVKQEREYPNLIHQKLSAEIARLIFGVKDEEILSAIAHHTTLKAHPSKLESAVFIADKIEWDQGGNPPYIKELKQGLDTSLECGVDIFIKYLYKTAHLIHPLLQDAYEYFDTNNQ